MKTQWVDKKYLKLKAVSKATKKRAELLAGENIYMLDKDGHAICGTCNKHIKVQAKHLESCKCPKCGKEETVQYSWRMRQTLEESAMVTQSERLDDKCVVIRFVMATRKPQKTDYCGEDITKIKGTRWETTEVARIYYHEDYAEPGFFEASKNGKKWRNVTSGQSYFRPDTYSILCRNPHWIMYAYQDTENAFEQFSQLDCFKYYPLANIWNNDKGIFQIWYLMRTARINEKLSKIGLTNLLYLQQEEFENSCNYSYYKGRAWLTGNKTVRETLRLDKRCFEIFKKAPSKALLHVLRLYPDAREDELFNSQMDEMLSCGGAEYAYKRFETVAKIAKKIHVSRDKVRKYLAKKGSPDLYEYEHYIDMLSVLKQYPLTDTYYSMPKKFKEADKRISDEYMPVAEQIRIEQEQKQLEKEQAKATQRAIERSKQILKQMKDQAKIDERIHKISQIIRDCEELRFWTHGSNGLKVIVPESVGELIDEGIKLHNCLGTYAEKIADKETLVFFIRRLNDPNKEYVALEYKNGEKAQIRFDHNIAVEDDNILQFANAFVKKLNAIDVMKQIRKVG